MKLALFLTVILPVLAGIGLIVGIWFLYVIKFRTVTAKPNQALLITGKNLGSPDNDPTVVKNAKGNYVKIIRGGYFRLKFQQNVDKIDLNSFQLHIKVEGITVKGSDVIDAEAVVQISVGDTNEHILNYTEQFLGKSQENIRQEVKEILIPHFRAILTPLSVFDINYTRESVNKKVSDIAKADLSLLGFKISSFGLGSLSDSDSNYGYLATVERKRKAEMSKEAEIVEAEAEKEKRIKKAEAERLATETENIQAIEIAESIKERELRESKIKKEIDKTKAEAEAVYELEKAIQSKTIELEETEVAKIKRNGERQLSLIQAEEQREVAMKQAQQKLEEETKLQETLKIKAQSESEIKRIQANMEKEVSLTIAKSEAEVSSEKAKALSQKIRLESEADAKRLEDIGRVEAHNILEKGKAEAEAERLLAVAKLTAKDIHLQELAIKTAPQIAQAIATSIGAIQEVKVFSTGEGSDGVTSSMTSSLASGVGTTYELLKDLTGIDMSEIALNKSKQHQVVINQETKDLSDVQNVVVETNDVKPENLDELENTPLSTDVEAIIPENHSEDTKEDTKADIKEDI